MTTQVSISQPVTAPPARRRKHSGVLQWLCIAILAGWAVVAIIGPWITPHHPDDFIADDAYASAARSIFGTDYLGRDIFSRLIEGARVTLGMSLAATLLAHAIGISLGLLAATRGGVIDMLLGRLAELVLSLPKIIVGLVIIAAMGPSFTVLVTLTGVVYSAAVFRIARSLAADVAVMDYVRVARARGESTAWIVFREILPNILRPLAADFALRLSFAMLFISSLSFLGLGVQPPDADWGALVRENISALSQGKLTPIYPAAAIASVTIALNLLVDQWSSEAAR
ncbi:ABC transporter permease [Bordetella sp. 15P40C-2]|uniref:ABC transporter permease n=1 Tax=Bordetella sp. 15P40C-2 TaxID=2572246 RepID=UPI001328A135|nr:ABC transporter permease [Bordetella sp. 15P40C-2]MVW72929.1 ABC transporter permease subunit [Bordetella sp. 15P40C-2]